MMIIDCTSDLHGFYPDLLGGDLLIIAGDLTKHDTLEDHEKLRDWLLAQQYQKIVVIAGNHDNALLHHWPLWAELKNIAYLRDSGCEFEGFKIWGSSWTRRFEGMNPKAMAFTLDDDESLAEKWALIPDDTNILVTHSPPYAVFDLVDALDNCRGNFHVGSLSLANRCEKLNLTAHIFGHIHEGYGGMLAEYDFPVKFYVNASHVNEYYEPVNAPIRITIYDEWTRLPEPPMGD